MQHYLYRWLMTVGLMHCLLGLIFVVFIQTGYAQPYLNYLAEGLALPASSAAGVGKVMQLFGPTVASWGLLFCVAIEHYRVTGSRRVKWLIVLAVLVWLIFDCAISASHGLYWHWAINSLVALAILPPLFWLQARD